MDDKALQRIDGVIRHINNVQKRLEGITFESFKSSQLLVDATSFSIAQIGERLVKLEELLKDKYPDLPWKSARNMRNIIVHDYDHADPKEVYSTAVNNLPLLKEQFYIIKNDIQHLSDKALTTDRLLLRPWDDLDVDELYELAKDPEIGYWCGWGPHKSIGDSLFVLHNFLEIDESYAIVLKANQKIIGSIGLKPKTDKKDEHELGFWIGKTYWGNGFATEAGERIVSHAFGDLGSIKIWCGYFEGNEKSKRVQEKLGFTFHHIAYDNGDKTSENKRACYISYLENKE